MGRRKLVISTDYLDEPMPSGWWLLPAIVIGTFFWVGIVVVLI